MRYLKKHQFQHWAQDGIFVILLLTLAFVIAYFAYQYDIFNDVTQNKNNSVSESSAAILKDMHDTIRITAFVNDDAAYRNEIRQFINKYIRTKKNIELTFINPATEPKLAIEAGTKANGELVIAYQKRVEHLLPPFQEEEFTNLLLQISKSVQQQIFVFNNNEARNVIGHGEHDLGIFSKKLITKGYNLTTGELPQHIKQNEALPVIMIVGSRVNLTSLEVEKIKRYINAGANFMWLIDNPELGALTPLAEELGLVISQGIVIDSDLAKFGGKPTTTYAVQYGDHPSTRHFRTRTSFPRAHQVQAHGTYQNGWKVQDLVHVAPNGWLESNLASINNQKNPPTFNAKEDVAGPVNIAVAMSRTYETKGQRGVVIGNVDFLSNQFISDGGNLALGAQTINWLSNDNNYLKIPPRTLKDVRLNIDTESHYKVVFMFFQILLPLALFIFGIVNWWSRRKI